MGWAAAAAAGLQIVGGLIANESARGGRDAASRAAQSAREAIEQLQIPDIEKQKIYNELPQVMGQYFPEAEVSSALGPSQMEGISTDPRLRDAQMQALEKLSTIGQEGLTAEDRLALNTMRRQVAGDEQAKQGQILQNMAQRGMGGSGAELAARLQSSQSSADRASQESDRIAAMAQQRALQGITQAGTLGGQIRSQDYGEQADRARAADSIAQFNLQNQQSVQQRNIQARNQAQQQNLANQQRVAEQQVALRNQQQQYNNQLLQQQYQNERQRALDMNGVYNSKAAELNGQAQQQAGQTKDIFTGVGGIVGSLGQSSAPKKEWWET